MRYNYVYAPSICIPQQQQIITVKAEESVVCVPFLKVLREYMSKHAKENSLTDKTIEKHSFHYNNIAQFFAFNGLTDIRVHEVRVKHMEHLRLWLHNNISPCSLEHSTRHIRLCRDACHYAVAEEYMPFNRLAGVKAKRGPEKEIVSCTVEDVNKFMAYRSKRELRNYVVKLFLYQCLTGISFMDIWKHDIVKEKTTLEDGTKVTLQWVTCETGRGKTKKLYWAIFLQAAEDIRNEFNGEFPRISNQVYNKTLRKVAKELGITRHLTTHIGRKTYATLKRHEGYSLPAIAGMLGSTEEVVRKHYVHAGKELIINEMLRIERQKNSFRRAA
jgi:integrase/recombinase XerD